jgi:hypothetical protein
MPAGWRIAGNFGKDDSIRLYYRLHRLVVGKACQSLDFQPCWTVSLSAYNLY